MRDEFKVVLRELEGSTHGGPRQHHLYDELRTMVENDPAMALDMIDQLPTSARSILVTAVSGLGRRVLRLVLDRLDIANIDQARDAAMILYIWAQRGLLSAHDLPAIVAASDIQLDPACQRILAATIRTLSADK